MLPGAAANDAAKRWRLGARIRPQQPGRQASEVIKSIPGMLRRSNPAVAVLDIKAIVQEVIALVQGELKQRGIALHVDCAESPRPIAGDKVHLQQVLINL